MSIGFDKAVTNVHSKSWFDGLVRMDVISHQQISGSMRKLKELLSQKLSIKIMLYSPKAEVNLMEAFQCDYILVINSVSLIS